MGGGVRPLAGRCEQGGGTVSEPQWEPEKIEIGLVCHVERTFCGSVMERRELKIAKLTPKRAYLGGYTWFALDDPERIVKPRYINYTTRVVRIEKAVE